MAGLLVGDIVWVTPQEGPVGLLGYRTATPVIAVVLEYEVDENGNPSLCVVEIPRGDIITLDGGVSRHAARYLGLDVSTPTGRCGVLWRWWEHARRPGVRPGPDPKWGTYISNANTWNEACVGDLRLLPPTVTPYTRHELVSDVLLEPGAAPHVVVAAVGRALAARRA
jgi:hypothetical protein